MMLLALIIVAGVLSYVMMLMDGDICELQEEVEALKKAAEKGKKAETKTPAEQN